MTTPFDVASYLHDLRALLDHFAETQSATICEAGALLTSCIHARGKLLICGNGGSAADAQHMAAELVGRLRSEFDRPAIPALALNTDGAVLTAWANDASYEAVFARQIEALGNASDGLVAISTSGRSPSIIAAVMAARRKGMRVVALTQTHTPLATAADVAIVVPRAITAHVQEVHGAAIHLMCLQIEEALYAKSEAA